MRLLLPLVLIACEAPPGPQVEQRDCALRVRYEAAGTPSSVRVVGPGIDRALEPAEGGQWIGVFSVEPGRLLYRIEVDGEPELDADNPLSAHEEGEAFSVFEAADCSAPSFRLVSRTDQELHLRLQRVGDGLDPSSVLSPVPFEYEGDDVYLDVSALPRGKHHLRVEASDTAGRRALHEGPLWQDAERFRWEDALIYQVVLDRFAAEAPFGPADRVKAPGARLGGNLKGVLKHLQAGYFDGLGANVLWLSPLNRNPEGKWTGVEGGAPRYEGYHGYWPVHPREVEPSFGTEEDVEAVVAEAHARGIRVLMDVVLNHVHQNHPYFRDHPEWFNEPCACGSPDCPWFTDIETCWFTGYLPDFSWTNTAMLDAQVEDALWWLERFDLDGLRVDAVPMMPRFVTRHLTHRLHQRFEQFRARHYLLGETFTGAGGHDTIRWYLGPDGLDGQFDFPLMWSLRRAFAWETGPLSQLLEVWADSQAAWAGSTAVMATMVGNHDVTRFLSEAAGQIDASNHTQAWTDRPPPPQTALPYQRLLLAQAFVLTVPGAPILYYGDEFGLPGVGDPDNRRPMRFGAERSPLEQETAAKVTRLARLRRCSRDLRRAELVPLLAENERVAYRRGHTLVVLNRRPEEATLSLQLPTDAPDEDYVEVLSGRRLTRTPSGLEPLALSPRTPAVLLPASDRCLR